MTSVSRALLVTLGGMLLIFGGGPDARAQGKCGFLSGQRPSPWLSVDLGAGIGLPIPASADMQAKRVVPSFGATVLLHLPHRFAVGLTYGFKKFEEDLSLFEYGKFHDILLRGSIAAYMSRRVQWDIFLLAGITQAQVRFLKLDPKKPLIEQDGAMVYNGDTMIKDITALASGLGSRVSFYPIDALGIFLDVAVQHAFQKSLELEEGALNLNLRTGVEGHF